MEDNIAVLVDAKIEYTKQLTNILIPFIFEGIKSIYTSTLSMCKMNNDRSVLMRFQEQLSQIPKWNQELIDEEYDRIISNSKCDWLDDLVTAVFLSHTKILTAIKSGSKQNKINLKIPKIDHFIHKCYIESAREFWKNPYIFSNNVSQSEYQRNISDGHKIIGSCIEETIRKLLPVKNILKEYLGPSYEDNNSLLPENYKDNLRKLVQKEMEICKKGGDLDEEKIIEKLENISDLDKDDIEEVNIGLKPKSKELKIETLEEEKPIIEEISNLETKELNLEDFDLDLDTLEQQPINESTSNEEVRLEENKEVKLDENKDTEINETKEVKLDKTEELEVKEVKEVKLDENKETEVNEVTEVKLDENKETEVKLDENKETEIKLDENKETEIKLDENKETEVKLDENKELEVKEIKLDENKETEVKLHENKETEVKLDKTEELVKNEEVNLDIVKLNEVELDNNLDSLDLDMKEVNLTENVKESENNVSNISSQLDITELNLEDVNLESSNDDKNIKLEPENKDVKQNSISPDELFIKEANKEVEEFKILEDNKEIPSDNEELKEVKKIIDNELYNKKILDTSDEEAIVENMKFKKVNLDSLNIEKLEEDLDFDNFETVKKEDISLENNNTSTQENLNSKKDTKTIIIDDSSSSLNRYSKPKKKSFKFFD